MPGECYAAIEGSAIELSPIRLSIQVAGVATLIMLPLGILAAWWLAHGRPVRVRVLIETLFTLPLVLPPTVVGYYLLLMLGRGTEFGRWLNDSVGIRLLFTWQGAAVAAAAMALPLFIKTASAAFASVDRELLEMGRTLGASDRALLIHVIIPSSYRGVIAGLTLGFARAIGEFGATLMVAGSIPGRTQTMPLALYAAVQDGEDHTALLYTLLLTVTAFVLLGMVSVYTSRLAVHRGEH
jgi:molybdate transport system permease protein